MPQKSRPLELALEDRGEAPKVERSAEASTAPEETKGSGASGLMERALSRPNMFAALKRVRKNKGSPRIDAMTVDELPDWLKEHWPRVRGELLAGAYQPQPVKQQLIPKPGGGQRERGIPTVLDRLIQQALLQVLQPLFDPGFSDHSYGFRPGRVGAITDVDDPTARKHGHVRTQLHERGEALGHLLRGLGREREQTPQRLEGLAAHEAVKVVAARRARGPPGDGCSPAWCDATGWRRRGRQGTSPAPHVRSSTRSAGDKSRAPRSVVDEVGRGQDPRPTFGRGRWLG